MAQPGVTREPSMEEILASIRRIIESNEPDAGRPAGAGFAQKTFESDPADVDPMTDDDDPIRLTVDMDLPNFAAERPVSSPRIDVSQSRIDVASVQTVAPVREPVRYSAPQMQPAFASQEAMAALAAASVQDAASTQEPEQRSLSPAVDDRQAPAAYEAARRDEEPRSISLADVAARVRAASERIVSDPTRQPVREAQPSPSARPVELRAAPTERVAEPIVRVATSVQPPRAPEPLPVDEDVRAALDVRLDQIDDDMLPVSNFVNEAEDDLLGEAEASKALVSATTGDQVARSFHELAEMVNSSAKRSIDEVAEDLLRPMLQEWLDDNLPTLVERLVREEIERVARGPRR